MRRGVILLGRRLADVEAYDPTRDGLHTDELEKALATALDRVYGPDTIERQRYDAVNFDMGPLTMSLHGARQDRTRYVVEGRERILRNLRAAIRALEEELQDLAGEGIAPSEVSPSATTPPAGRLSSKARTGVQTGGVVTFIGHGHSPVWRELKDFLKDRLGLAVSEFNAVSAAGIPTIDRLHDVLDTAAFAFIIMTGEDEQADGELRARQNVIHEAGLFQGRLGFSKAIILLEDGCGNFSNIHGLGVIPFAKGNIGSSFEEVRRVLEREAVSAR